MATSLSFGQLQWDPVSIVAQITVIQCCYYMVLGLLIVIGDAIFDCIAFLQVDQLFDPVVISFATPLGRASILAFVINSLVIGLILVKVVGRAKRVLDFSATSFIVHLAFVMLFSGFPLSWRWWLLQAICVTLQTLLAEFICIRREMKEISMAQPAVQV